MSFRQPNPVHESFKARIGADIVTSRVYVEITKFARAYTNNSQVVSLVAMCHTLSR